uniref:C-type lectin TsL n=1 Tax=Trimeresurus stejnegeri TaxID=39682 RepID=LECG_TRIST|nr:RecName: Full=C-type lectin TsL; AltName: Full=Galactose-binding lectin; Short=CTL; Flags: Precursor [Trimeresurus stejnegeri]AAD17252.1 C-type lectin [Trimeresurus stejnegeri]
MGRFIFVSFGLLVVFLSLSGAKGSCCTNDSLPMNGMCYKIFDEPKTWEDAEMFCRKYKPGCHLASFHRLAESLDIAEYISDYHKRQAEVWIGLLDRKKDFSWEWTDRSCTDYLNWDKNQPDHYKDKEFCVELVSLTGYHRWNDQVCESKNSFLCQCKF